MKQLILSLAILLFSLQSWCQSSKWVKIIGRVYDNETGDWLSSASIVCLTSSDSTTVRINLTDNTGRFKIDSIPRASYYLHISFLGYSSINKSITISTDQNIVDVENIAMQRKGISLNQIDVIQQKTPLKIKKDTLEFSAAYFQPKESDLMENLLKKIPGIQIDNNGTISVNGKVVKYILVNGQAIFSGADLKVVSQNLMANIVDKIQIIDSKEKQPGLSSSPNEKPDKVINITTKKSIQNLPNGQLSGAVGTSKAVGAKVNLNLFKEDQQIIFIGNGDNINGLLDAQAMQKKGTQKNWIAGINYSNHINSNINISASYQTQNLQSEDETNSSRLTFVNDTGYYYNQDTKNKNSDITHRFNSGLELNIDSTFKITLSNQLLITYTHKTMKNTYESFRFNNDLINSGTIYNVENTNVNSMASNLVIDKNFKKKRRSTRLFIGYSYSNTDGTENNQSYNHYYKNDIESIMDTLNMKSTNKQSSNNFYLSIDYTEPISKKSSLVLTYGETRVNQPINKEAFSFNKTTNKYDIPNDSLSGKFKSTFSQRFGKIGWLSQLGVLDYTISLAWILAGTNNNDRYSNATIRTKGSGVLPYIRLNYSFPGNKSVQFAYFRSANFPGINELQPTIDNKDPLYIKKGNPNLNPSWIENIDLSYNTLNINTLSSLYIGFNGTFIRNQIVNGTSFDSTGRQIIQPLNLNGATKFGLNIYKDIPLNSFLGTIKLNTNASYNKELNYINGIKGSYKNISLNQSISYNYKFKKIFDISASSNINYNITKFSSSNTTKNKNTIYNFLLENNINLPSEIVFNTMLYLEWSNGDALNYNSKNILLNTGVSKTILKRKQGLIKLQVYDLLNQNMNISQNIGSNYLEYSRTNVLGRFILLKFSYLIGKK